MKKLNSFLQEQSHHLKLYKAVYQTLSSIKASHLALGFSGGADSAMLLVCASLAAQRLNKKLSIIHIHHGLFEQADHWVHQCQRLCDLLEQKLDVRYVQVNQRSGLGIEAAARIARYQAYTDYCKTHQIKDFLLAHHLNDQAETILMRLFRGTGVQGMIGMRNIHQYKGLNFYRPWLDIDRQEIIQMALTFQQVFKWVCIQDPSNLDPKYKRGALRQLVIPQLNKIWPSWKRILQRHARLMSEANEIISEVAKEDFLKLDVADHGLSFSLAKWRELSKVRQVNVIRYYLIINDIPMPTERRLNNWLKQFREVHALGFDRAVTLKHANWWIRVYKGRVIVESNQNKVEAIKN